jgi:uncharacterized integral membrane protein
MTRPKLYSALVLALLAVLVILQNTTPVQANFLFWPLTTPLAILLLITLLIGFVLGMVITLLTGRRKEKPRPH